MFLFKANLLCAMKIICLCANSVYVCQQVLKSPVLRCVVSYELFIKWRREVQEPGMYLYFISSALQKNHSRYTHVLAALLF